MTAIDDGYEDDWYDDGGYREPDPEDAEIAQAYEEYYDHCDQIHGGGECDCRPSLPARLRWGAARAGRRLAGIRHGLGAFAREMHTARLGPLELTARFRPPPACNACSGRGWFWTRGTTDPYPPPPAADGAALCGCGSAIARLAESRRAVRRTRSEPPF